MDSSRVRLGGPLAPYRDGLWAELLAQGYTPLSGLNLLRLMAHLSRWMEAQRMRPGELTSEQIDRFVRRRKASGYTHWLTPGGLEPVLRHLRRVGVVPSEDLGIAKEGPHGLLLKEYEDYLVRERALEAATVRAYLKDTTEFLFARFGGGSFDVGRLKADDITSFILRQSRSYGAVSVNHKVCSLRSFLRFLHVRGDISHGLATCVPAMAQRRLAGLPKALAPGVVEKLLRSCDRRTHVGVRDFAAMLLMARLGLRASEVAALRLEDLDWTRGEIVIRGKPRRQDRLPLPHDVGEAVARYLQRRRPRNGCRQLFLRVRAPYGPISKFGVKDLVSWAGTRAGLADVSSHRLRHTVATQMLRGGATLSEVAQVLRHRHIDTTAIYAKVDRSRLRSLARPWPGGKR